MPSFSIIIPALGRTDLLESTLVSVLENRPNACEIIVVLACEYDDPYQLKDEVRFIPARPGAGLVECLNLGIEASGAPVVHVLAAGVEATEGWSDAVLRHFSDRRVAAVAPLVVDWLDHRKVIAAGVGYAAGGSRKLSKAKVPAHDNGASDNLGPTSMAGFYRKSALAVVGGFQAPSGDALADVDLALRLRYAGFRTAVESSSRVHASGEHRFGESALKEAMAAEAVFWRNFDSSGCMRQLLLHLVMLVTECVRNCYRPSLLARIAGRLASFCRVGSHIRHRRQMQACREAARNASAESQLSNLRIDRPHPGTRSGQPTEARVRQ